MVARHGELRREYESVERARHYHASRWARSARARRTDAKEQAIVAAFLSEAGPLERVLDLPCGSGRFRPLLQRSCGEVWSADASREMLVQDPPQIGFQASAHAIPLQSACVDGILCSRLLHHFEQGAQRGAILRELARVTRGWVILSYFDAASLQAWRNRVRGRQRGRYPIPRSTFTAELQAAELVERKRRYIARGVSEQVWVLAERMA